MKSNAQPESYPPLIDRVVVVTGPTASGKSDLGISLSKRMSIEIVSLDSIAVYRHMNVGTAKPTVEQQSQVPHHLIDLVDPSDEFSVAEYLGRLHPLLDQIESRHRVPILVGGTPLYLRAVLRGFAPGPPPDWDFRTWCEQQTEGRPSDWLWTEVQKIDEPSAAKIHPADHRRLIRAWEFYRQTGASISSHQNQFGEVPNASDVAVFGVTRPRAELHTRIEKRVDLMLDGGLVEEVRGLIDRFKVLSRTARQAVGYREVIDHVEGKIDHSACRQQIIEHTRRLARKQSTWMRSSTEVTPIDLSSLSVEEAVDLMLDRIKGLEGT
ncbi:MAG: tRNA (adenosine(37)-N6)-dimethylallyltransferase MiaA [Planctomycetota bacterium]